MRLLPSEQALRCFSPAGTTSNQTSIELPRWAILPVGWSPQELQQEQELQGCRRSKP